MGILSGVSQVADGRVAEIGKLSAQQAENSSRHLLSWRYSLDLSERSMRYVRTERSTSAVFLRYVDNTCDLNEVVALCVNENVFSSLHLFRIDCTCCKRDL